MSYRVGWSEARQPTAGEVSSAPVQDSPARIPATDENGYLFFASLPGSGDPEEAAFDGGSDILGAFRRRSDVTLDGRAWHVWSTDALQSSSLLGGGSRTLSVVFPLTTRATADDPSLAEVKLALRIDDDGFDAILANYLADATARANSQAPTAPPQTKKNAVFMACGWLFEAPGEIGGSAAGWWRRSGAESLLRPWTRRRGGVIG